MDSSKGTVEEVLKAVKEHGLEGLLSVVSIEPLAEFLNKFILPIKGKVALQLMDVGQKSSFC